MRLVPCLDSLWSGRREGLEEQLSAVRTEGYTAIEIWDWRGKDLTTLEHGGLAIVVMSGNTFEEPLVDPAAREKAMAHLVRSLAVAERLGCRKLVIHPGYRITGIAEEAQRRSFFEFLGEIVRENREVTFLLEPLNSQIDHPGYFLDSLPEALAILKEIDAPNLRLLFDCYHVQVMRGSVLADLEEALPFVEHLHIADYPGRGEPGTGGMDYPSLLQRVRSFGYEGDVGLEFWTPDPVGSLRRVRGLVPCGLG